MVRLINNKNIKYVSELVYRILKIQELFTYIRNYNEPQGPCIYVMWHENQFSVHGITDRNKVNILISTSLDGQIVADVCEKWGFKVYRGSSGRKGSVTSTLKMLSSLKEGDSVAIMVDGPRGPYHEVKQGAVLLAKEANVPLIPLHWYSEDKTFRHLPSWDKLTLPVGPCRLLNLYGDPIYTDGKTDEQIVDEIKKSLKNLENIAPEKYKEAMKSGLWKKKKV